MFKVGDKVVCFDAEGINIYGELIKIGGVYTIHSFRYDTLLVLEKIEGIWNIDRFKKYNYRKEKLQRICSK